MIMQMSYTHTYSNAFLPAYARTWKNKQPQQSLSLHHHHHHRCSLIHIPFHRNSNREAKSVKCCWAPGQPLNYFRFCFVCPVYYAYYIVCGWAYAARQLNWNRKRTKLTIVSKNGTQKRGGNAEIKRHRVWASNTERGRQEENQGLQRENPSYTCTHRIRCVVRRFVQFASESYAE